LRRALLHKEGREGKSDKDQEMESKQMQEKYQIRNWAE